MVTYALIYAVLRYHLRVNVKTVAGRVRTIPARMRAYVVRYAAAKGAHRTGAIVSQHSPGYLARMSHLSMHLPTTA